MSLGQFRLIPSSFFLLFFHLKGLRESGASLEGPGKGGEATAAGMQEEEEDD